MGHESNHCLAHALILWRLVWCDSGWWRCYLQLVDKAKCEVVKFTCLWQCLVLSFFLQSSQQYSSSEVIRCDAVFQSKVTLHLKTSPTACLSMHCLSIVVHVLSVSDICTGGKGVRYAPHFTEAHIRKKMIRENAEHVCIVRTMC